MKDVFLWEFNILSMLCEVIYYWVIYILILPFTPCNNILKLQHQGMQKTHMKRRTLHRNTHSESPVDLIKLRTNGLKNYPLET